MNLIRMNIYKTIIYLLIVIFSFSSCAQIDEENKDISNGKVQIELQLPSVLNVGKQGSDNSYESAISNISLFIFDAATGSKEFYVRLQAPFSTTSSDIDMSRWATDHIVTILNSSILSRLNIDRNIHIVCNSNDSRLSSLSTEQELKDLITETISAEIKLSESKLLLLHGVVSNHNFSNNTRASIALVRNVAKVVARINTESFSLAGKQINFLPEGTTMKFAIGNVADRSYLVSRGTSPSGIAYINYPSNTPEVQEYSSTRSKLIAHAYINENLRDDYNVERNATFLTLNIPYQLSGDSRIYRDNYYKILLNQEGGFRIDRNTIYDLTLNIKALGGQTESSAILLDGLLNILQWNENTLTSDISQTYLSVNETVTQISNNKDFYYATNVDTSNGENCALIPGASWLTASFEDANTIKMTASGVDYLAPRSTTLKIKINNLIKVITVNQSAVPVLDASIGITPRKIFLSDKDAYAGASIKEAALTVRPADSQWVVIDGNSAVASINTSTGMGSSKLIFTRGGTYDNTYYKVLNRYTMRYDSVQVCNLNLTAEPSVSIGGQGGETKFDDVIIAEGGDANWYVKSVSDTWMTVSKTVNNELKIVATEGPDEQERRGFVVIAHINDPNYTKKIEVIQEDHVIVTIPEFDYLVFRYNWEGAEGGKDLDTATEFVNSKQNGLDGQGVGWSTGVPNPLQLNKQDILVWGGDNVNQNAGESVYINVKNLMANKNESLPRFVKLNLFANWYSSPSSLPIKVEISAYKGGTMLNYGTNTSIERLKYNFYNEGGRRVDDISEADSPTRIISTLGSGKSQKYATEYTYVAEVTYDIVKRTAVIIMAKNNERPGAFVRAKSKINVIQPLPGESKQDFERRVNLSQRKK